MLPFPNQFYQGDPRAVHQMAPLMNMNMMQHSPMFYEQQMFMPAMPQMVPSMGMLLSNQARFKSRGGRGPGGLFPGNQFNPQQYQQPRQPYPRNDLRNNLKRKFSDPDTSGRKAGRFQKVPHSLLNSFITDSSAPTHTNLINGAMPIAHVPGQPCDKVTEAIVEYYNNYHQTEQDLKHKIVLSECLFAIVREIFPGCRLFIVGSSMSGFGTHTSDMDLCLLVSQIQAIDQKNEAVHILSAIHRCLGHCTFIKSSQVIRAKVPILKFTDSKKSIECDLNINNGVGIRNTHLLKYYSLCDPRVAPLMLFIKFWARFHDINDARKRTISSYSLALMLIHYLQVCQPPVLPCLQQLYPERFDVNVDLKKLQLTEPLKPHYSRNTQSLGTLFQGFLDYYAYQFRPECNVISVRKGCVLDKHMVQMNSMEPNQWKCLCIEGARDLLILGLISSSIRIGPVTDCSKRKTQKERQRSRSCYSYMGRQVCTAAFRWILGRMSKDRLQSLQDHFKENGLVPRKLKSGGRKCNTASLSIADSEHIKHFITQYAEDHAVSLPGRVPGFKRCDIQLLPSSHPKSRVYRSYEESADRAEPYDLSNTARSVFDDFIFQRVKRVFWRSAEALFEEGDVSAILTQPF